MPTVGTGAGYHRSVRPLLFLPVFILGTWSWAGWQDSRAGSRPAPQTLPASRRALPDAALEGTWQLVRFVRPLLGNATAGSEARGYLVFTRTHLSMHLSEKVPDNVYPRLQSSFRQYQVVNDEIVTTSLLGFLNDDSGDVVLEGSGRNERRRFTVIGNTLRIYQTERSWLELTRVE